PGPPSIPATTATFRLEISSELHRGREEEDSRPVREGPEGQRGRAVSEPVPGIPGRLPRRHIPALRGSRGRSPAMSAAAMFFWGLVWGAVYALIFLAAIGR